MDPQLDLSGGGGGDVRDRDVRNGTLTTVTLMAVTLMAVRHRAAWGRGAGANSGNLHLRPASVVLTCCGQSARPRAHCVWGRRRSGCPETRAPCGRSRRGRDRDATDPRSRRERQVEAAMAHALAAQGPATPVFPGQSSWVQVCQLHPARRHDPGPTPLSPGGPFCTRTRPWPPCFPLRIGSVSPSEPPQSFPVIPSPVTTLSSDLDFESSLPAGLVRRRSRPGGWQ
jgi:hypothetical protein